MLARSVCL